jgi:hypothetical protein
MLLTLPHMRASLSLIVCAIVLVGCRTSALTEDRVELAIGESSINVVTVTSRDRGQTWINIHENERTSVDAALEVIERVGGKVIFLEHGGERNISFEMDGETYIVDPNRIYTEAGIRATLENLGPISEEAVAEVQRFSSELIAHLGLDTMHVALTIHNNRAGGYSAASYMPGEAYENDAADVRIHEGVNTDDFFFITEEAWVEPLAQAGFNVVLQDNTQVTDDGSMSVYCGQRGIPYVNVEARHGHLDAQVAMIEFLDRFLRQQAGALTQAE